MKLSKQEQPPQRPEDEITRLPESHGIPLDQWGKGEAKTLRHLLEEIDEGEASLQVTESRELVRQVVVVGVEVTPPLSKIGNLRIANCSPLPNAMT